MNARLRSVAIIAGVVVVDRITKLYIQHFRRRKNYRRLRGHRQHYLRLRVKHILLPGQEPAAAPPAAAPPPAAPAPAQPAATPA